MEKIYISLSDAMECVDKRIDELRKDPCFQRKGVSAIIDIAKVNEYLLSVPAADVVEVVRCKDCDYGKCKHQDMHLCYKDGKDVPPDFHEPEWFCADGQRLE